MPALYIHDSKGRLVKHSEHPDYATAVRIGQSVAGYGHFMVEGLPPNPYRTSRQHQPKAVEDFLSAL